MNRIQRARSGEDPRKTLAVERMPGPNALRTYVRTPVQVKQDLHRTESVASSTFSRRLMKPVQRAGLHAHFLVTNSAITLVKYGGEWMHALEHSYDAAGG